MLFLTFIVLLAAVYFLYIISETLIDVKDELRAANRNREIAMHQVATTKDVNAKPSEASANQASNA